MMYNMKKFFSLLLLASLFMCSCTVSEPDVPTGDPSKVRLTAVKSMGITLISVNYDKQGRITKINAGNDIVYNLSYEGTSAAPSEVVTLEYDTFDVNDKEVRQKVSETVWTNIRVNSDGYITSCSISETDWDYDTEYDYNTGKWGLTLRDTKNDKYDGTLFYHNGHLIKSHDTDGEESIYNWDGDLLMYVNDGDGTLELEYSNVENVNLQWDPNNEILGPIAITGFFGKAPARFIKASKFDGDYGEKIQYSYSLLDNGLINMCRVLDSDDPEYEPVLNYIYEKVK